MKKLPEEIIDELEALRSIYSTDFEERETTWSDLESKANIWGCPSFAIKIRPLSISLHRRVTEAQVKVIEYLLLTYFITSMI